jgi:multicomponent Na+:H+ antiporter subunit F
VGIVLTVLTYLIPVYIIALILYVYRAFQGPTISDQVLAINVMTYDLAAFLVVLSIYLRIPVLVAVSIVLALWIYVFDTYIARYLEKRGAGE